MWLYRQIGGEAVHPLCVPEPLVRALDISFFGTMALAALAVPLFFWRSRVKAFVLPVVAYGLSLVGVLNAVAPPIVRNYVVESDRVPASLDGYRIVQISDIHASCGCRRWHTEAIVAVANGLAADLVCLTGDFVDGRPQECADYLEPLRELRARDGVFAVMGNHEFIDRINPVDEWNAYYAKWGIPFLRASGVVLRPGLALGGVDDKVSKFKHEVAPDVAKAFAAATNGEFRVLMQHRPTGVEDNVARAGVDLQLSGHLHGGFMPIMGERIAADNGRRLRGLHRIGSGWLCLSAGCGPWGGFPLRFRTPTEISLVTLRSAKRSR